MKRSVSEGWISINERGDLSLQDAYKLPDNSQWARMDMNITIKMLDKLSNVESIEKHNVIDLTPLFKSA